MSTVDYAGTYSSCSSSGTSNDSDVETPFKNDDQTQKSLPGDKKKLASQSKLIKLKRRSIVLTDDDEIEGGKSDEIPRDVTGRNVDSNGTTSELPSHNPKEKKTYRRQRLIVDDDSDDGE